MNSRGELDVKGQTMDCRHYPSVDVEPAMVLRETAHVRRVLVRYGVKDRDLSDVAQEVFIGFAWRHAILYGRISHRRHERLASEPLQDFAIDATVENRIDARTSLELFERVPRKLKEVLVLVAFGAEPCEAADELGISREAALQRIRNGRERFHRAIARWR